MWINTGRERLMSSVTRIADMVGENDQVIQSASVFEFAISAALLSLRHQKLCKKNRKPEKEAAIIRQ